MDGSAVMATNSTNGGSPTKASAIPPHLRSPTQPNAGSADSILLSPKGENGNNHQGSNGHSNNHNGNGGHSNTMEFKRLNNSKTSELPSTSTPPTIRKLKVGKRSPGKPVDPDEHLNVYQRWQSYETEPHVRCNSNCDGGRLIEGIEGSLVETVWDTFVYNFTVKEKCNCLGWREGKTYKWWTYGEVYLKALQLGQALVQKASLKPGNVVGIFAATVPMWVIGELGCMSRSLVVVPLYETLGAESCQYTINDVEMSVLLTDTTAAVKSIITGHKNTPTLRVIVVFQADLAGADAEAAKMAKEAGITLTTYDDFIAGVDATADSLSYKAKGDDLFMIQYTSGTTGNPKGVMLSNKNFVSQVSSWRQFLVGDPATTFSKDDIALLYLPLAHVYAQAVVIWFLYMGASIGFISGPVTKTLMEDAVMLQPTFIPLVPRIMNRLYSKVKEMVGPSGLKAKLFKWCYDRKKDLLDKGVFRRDTIYDMIAFRKVQKLLGGNVRIMTTGSAPIAADVLEFWRVVFGALIVEGYGQTECAAVATIAVGPGGANVGHPLGVNYIKLADVPDCGFFVEQDGRGEICIRGANVMAGYYKQPEKTAEAIDDEGWLHTGDIGVFSPDGALRVVDRKKHIFKLQQGEYIAPEKLEQVYSMCPLVMQVFLEGSPLESYTVAIVVAEESAIAAWRSKHPELAESNDKQICEDPAFVKHILESMLAIGKQNKLNSLEQVKTIKVLAPEDQFSVANDLLTPSLKNKRPVLRSTFKDTVTALYKAGPLLPPSPNSNRD